ncbi:M9 family metallopeptidase [Dokdonella sp.]|uniref:M9 family metallopeptidase n=1 Tax=Dokdonella sp. TaxID=2291710 RepID=UPI001B0A1436|nr:M9 family metallopeptidase [Dokdonella sp.]MBO9664149.1 M9 family metallopeptidase [Dokdonella sp.]
MRSFPRVLNAAVAGVLCLCGTLVAIGAAAAASAPTGDPLPPRGSPVADARVEHVQSRRIGLDRIAPISRQDDRRYLRYDGGRFDLDAPLSRETRQAIASVTARIACPNYGELSGAALADAVRGSTLEGCLYPLFNLTGAVAGATFGEAKMITIAEAIEADAPAYPGDNSAGMLQLIMFLRAGYYVQWNDREDVGDYGAALTAAIRPALDAFVANAHFTDADDGHGAVLLEFVTLIDSAGENAHQLDTVRGILDRYGPAMSGLSRMQAATNNAFNVLFRGHQNADFQALVQSPAGSGVLDTLLDFIDRNRAGDLGTAREYMMINAGRELARFLQYPDTAGNNAFHSALHPKVKAVLDAFPLSGSASPGAALYITTASVADYYDAGHCAYFETCDLGQTVEAAVLPAANARDCSPTLGVRSQALTSAQLDYVCSTVGGEEGYFHALAQTGQVPVADDHNAKLEMVIFHSSDDYVLYSNLIFGNSTDNGGIYLEGDPADPDNLPRFIAYEAEWLRPSFDVWNLTHEYIHYLDGRFNWHGAFRDYPLTAPASAVWFVEGFAEFVSYSYRELVDTSAVTEAGNPDRFTLGQVFDTEYSTDFSRTYQWGYLAVRFLFERHRDDITDLFTGVSRPGNYRPGYADWLTPIHAAYDAEFRAWVVCFASHNGDTSSCGGVQPPQDKIFGDGFDGEPPVEIPECTGPDGRLDNGCKRSGLSAPRDVDRVWLSILVPAGKTRLTFTTSGGSGDVDVYQKFDGWPGDADYDNASQLPGNEETLVVTDPAPGWHYLMLKPKSSSFEGVQISAAWE